MANPITKVVGWTLAKGANTRPYKWLEGKVNRKTAEDIIAYTTISSVAAKDIYGCVLYVNQSLHNDKIPEKRRKFVAALDLTNGVLMVASQIAMFFAMRKINDKLFHKLFKSFDKEGNALRRFTRQIRADERRVTNNPSKVHDKSTLRNEHITMKGLAFSLFKSVTELAAATIIAKRVFVPFVATPLAGIVEKKMNKKNETEDADTIQASFNPSMAGNIKDDYKQSTFTRIVDLKNANTQNTNLLEMIKQQSKSA